MKPDPSERSRMSGEPPWAALTTALPTKEAVKEILEGIVFVATGAGPFLLALTLSLALAAHPLVRVLDGRFGIDVDHCRLELASDGRKLIRHLDGRGNLQRCGISRRILLFPFNGSRNNRANQNT